MMNVDEAMAVAAKQGGLPETDEWHGEVIDAMDVLSAEVERLRAELAAAKAASVVPVKIVNLSHTDWGLALNVRCRSEDDSNVLWRWLRGRMKERGEG